MYGLLRWRMRQGEFPGATLEYRLNSKSQKKEIDIESKKIESTLLDLLLVLFAGGLIGGRIGYVLIYNATYFLANPWQIISPLDPITGNFEGLYGMSFHGALAGAIVGAYLFSKIRHFDWLSYADFIVPALPLGYFFGRIGNFLNGELIGRATTSNLGMYFSSNSTFLRYPSQIFEAFAEGLLLFIFLWKLRNKKIVCSGFFLNFYLLGYGSTRFVCEFFRQPDAQLGILFFGLTMGQLLSILLIFFASFLLFFKNKKSAILKTEIAGVK